MPAEHYRPNGKLSQGYFCSNCGQPCNMMGSGHRSPLDWTRTLCEPNLKLVKQLRMANPEPERKPHFIVPGVINNGAD